MLGCITKFASRFAGQGTRLSIAWERIFDKFERPRVAIAKDALPLWAPTTFVNDSRTEGGSVEAVFALVLDFDHGGRLEQAVDVLGEFYGVVHSTFSHTDEEHRFRCVLPFGRPVLPAEYSRVWLAAEAMCHSRALFPDPSTKNASRLWFVPAHRVGAPFVSWRLQGGILEPGILAKRWCRAPPKALASRVPARPTSYEERDRRLRRASAYLSRMPSSVSGQGGHQALWRAAIALVRGFQLDLNDAFVLLKFEFSPRCEPPWSDRELWHKCRHALTAAHVPFGYLGDGHAA
jgi:hypothetical protein